MTAREMFESLGWDCTRDDNEEIVYSLWEGDTITFYKESKEIGISLLTMGKKYVVKYTFMLEETRAILKQIEELGWN